MTSIATACVIDAMSITQTLAMTVRVSSDWETNVCTAATTHNSVHLLI